jgi:tripartite-type tricarboxylate transporter receptor subunit TctC
MTRCGFSSTAQLLALLAFASAPVYAQKAQARTEGAMVAVAATFPAKPVRLVTTSAPGGGADIVARALGQKLFELWGHPLVIDNRGGAGGVVGTELVSKATADGYTLLLGTNGGLVINPLLSTKLPYDPLRDFAPISLVVGNPQILVVNNSIAAGSVKELIVMLKARPGTLNYASVGRGSTTHLSMELFKSMTGTEMLHVPYKGAGPAGNELLAGQVHLMFSNMPIVLPHVRAGRLRGLAVSSANRVLAAPDIPTVAESGVTGFESVSWSGLFAPARTPGQLIIALNKQVVSILSDPVMAKRLGSLGAEPRPGTPEEATTYMREESQRWRKVIHGAGLRVD